MVELNAEDRYQVRKLQMDVDKKALEVQKSQQELDRFVLDMEHKYNLLEEGTSIDTKTGAVRGSDPPRNGKSSAQAALTSQLQEAAD